MENNIQRNGEPETAKGPPPVPIAKTNPTSNNLGSNTVKKDKRMNSSRFNISKNRELTPLSRLAGKCTVVQIASFNVPKSYDFDIKPLAIYE